MYIRPNSERVPPLRRFYSTALLALGMAGLLRAADSAPATSSANAAIGSAPAAQAPASAAAAEPAARKSDTARPSPAAGAVPAAAKAKPAKKLSKKAKAIADSTARADSLKAAAVADSLKAAQVRAAADSARAAEAKAADSLRADSARTAEARAKAAADSARIAAAADSVSADSAASKAKKRKRIVRETTVKTIDELKGRYRSPKKAMFMSLIVPGLGQAYVGHSWFNYARGATYFLTDVVLAYGWHYYVGTKQDREVTKYQAFADSNWRQYKYEDSVETYKERSATLNLHRESYCDYVQSTSTEKGKLLHGGCADPAKSSEYSAFKNEYDDKNESTADVSKLRAAFPNSQQFYELIGKENEFITGWLDAPAMKSNDSAWYAVDKDGNATKILATTANQQAYIAMRAQANDYARMQAWFLGGMVFNHIVSAVDAALTARYHNKALYQTETSCYDRVHLDSRIAWDGLAPAPSLTASLTF